LAAAGHFRFSNKLLVMGSSLFHMAISGFIFWGVGGGGGERKEENNLLFGFLPKLRVL